MRHKPPHCATGFTANCYRLHNCGAVFYAVICQRLARWFVDQVAPLQLTRPPSLLWIATVAAIDIRVVCIVGMIYRQYEVIGVSRPGQA